MQRKYSRFPLHPPPPVPYCIKLPALYFTYTHIAGATLD